MVSIYIETWYVVNDEVEKGIFGKIHAKTAIVAVSMVASATASKLDQAYNIGNVQKLAADGRLL